MSVAAIGFSGCQSIDKFLFFSENALLGSNGQSMNGIKPKRDGEKFTLRSAGIIRGLVRYDSIAKWRHYGSVGRLAGMRISIETADLEFDQISQFLRFSQPGCSSPIEQLEKYLNDSHQLASRVIGPIREPKIILRLSPYGKSIHFFEISESENVENATLYVIQPLPQGNNCAWIRNWSILSVDLIFHELVHLHNFDVYGGSLSRLDDETIAYGFGLCLFLQNFEALPARLQTGPEGADSDSIEDVKDWLNSGRISSSVAGAFVSDRLRRQAMGNRPLTPQDLPKLEAFCRKLARNETDVVRQKAFGP